MSTTLQGEYILLTKVGHLSAGFLEQHIKANC